MDLYYSTTASPQHHKLMRSKDQALSWAVRDGDGEMESLEVYQGSMPHLLAAASACLSRTIWETIVVCPSHLMHEATNQESAPPSHVSISSISVRSVRAIELHCAFCWLAKCETLGDFGGSPFLAY